MELALIPKREGARPNNTLIYFRDLNNLVVSDLLRQDITTDPFSSYFSTESSYVHSMIKNRRCFYFYKSTKQSCRNQHSHLAFTKITRVYKFPDSRMFSSKIGLPLSQNCPSYVRLHMLNQVVGAAESSNNQPSPLEQNCSYLHSQKKRSRVQASCLLNVLIKDQTTTQPKLPFI